MVSFSLAFFFVLLVGPIFSLGYVCTDILRTWYILKGCNISADAYIELELPLFVIADFAQLLSLVVFVWDIWKNYGINERCELEKSPTFYCKDEEESCCEESCCKSCCKGCKLIPQVVFALVLLFIMLCLTIATPAVGAVRDYSYINKRCAVELKWSHQIIAAFHTVVRVVVFSGTLAMCCSFMMIITYSAHKWKDN